MASEIRFAEIRKLLEQHGWRLVRISNSSHHIFAGEDRPMISIPVHSNKVKPFYVKKIHKAIRELEEDES